MKKILKKDIEDGGGLKFLVAWEGNWEPTWEPHELLQHAQDKIDQFLSEEQAEAKIKRSRGKKRKAPGAD